MSQIEPTSHFYEPTACASSRNEGTHEFAREGTTLPKLSGGIPEGLELSRPRAITSADPIYMNVSQEMDAGRYAFERTRRGSRRTVGDRPR